MYQAILQNSVLFICTPIGKSYLGKDLDFCKDMACIDDSVGHRLAGYYCKIFRSKLRLWQQLEWWQMQPRQLLGFFLRFELFPFLKVNKNLILIFLNF